MLPNFTPLRPGISACFLLLATSSWVLTAQDEAPRRVESNTIEAASADAIPQSYEAMWAGLDPTAEPLDIELLHEWEQDEVILRIVRFRIGIFKGKKSMLAGVYGYPKGGTKLPGLVNIHGGGQYADSNSAFTNAKRGYATISIAWAGRISSPKYRVSPREVALFFEANTNDPAYKLTTDWGALDGYHAPSRAGKDAFVSMPGGDEWRIDPAPSPRNNSWFLCTYAARRALTFLQEQPEVDGDKLGVYGHSMGGKLTVATSAADKRVKAAAPSCGGISDRYNPNPLHHATVGDSPALQHLDCPTIFLKPANDFHGKIDDLVIATEELGDTEWRVTCSPHLNHRDTPENEVASQLWFDQHLKGSFTWPNTPSSTLTLKTESGIPRFTVTPDASKKILGVDIFYTQQGLENEAATKAERIDALRFWHSAEAGKTDGNWQADLPVFSTDKPLWVYANVTYALDEPITGAGYYYGTYTTDRFNLSSLIKLASSTDLQAAGVKPSLEKSHVIESFEGEWRKEWYSYNTKDWSIRSLKLRHPIWAAPTGAKLSLELQADEANQLVIGLDGYVAVVELKGGPKPQTITLEANDFVDVQKAPKTDWGTLKELRILAVEQMRPKRNQKGETGGQWTAGGTWKGSAPSFLNLEWISE